MPNIQYTISGTCAGYKSFLRHSKNIEKEKINIIDNRGYDKASTKGKSCYSISIQEDYYIFSKIQIIRDGLRSQSIGFVKLNLIIPINIKVDTNIIQVLDEGLRLYIDEFTDDNQVLIDEGKNHNYDNEIEKIVSEIPIKDKQNYRWKTGILKPGFVYVRMEDLYIYFVYEHIFQNEYKKNHEIYFIDENDKGEDCILNALKNDSNSNLTDLIKISNFANPKYSIRLSSIEKGINYTGPTTGEQVNSDENIEIVFYKENYETEKGKSNLRGSLKDLMKEHPQILKKSETEPHTIEIIQPKFKPIEKEIKLRIDNQSDEINDLEEIGLIANISGKKERLIINGNKVKLKGNDFGKDINLEINNSDYKLITKSIKQNKFVKNQYEPIKIELIKKGKGQSSKIKIITMSIGIIILGYSLYYIFPSFENNEVIIQTDMTTKKKPNQISENSISNYLNGSELLMDTLKKYKDFTKSDSLKEKINKTISFRKAIDGNDRNKIQYAFDSIKGLNTFQNKILKDILDKFPSSRFKEYEAIDNRKFIYLSNFQDTLQKYALIEEVKIPVENKKEQTKKSKASNTQPKYSEEEFLNIIKNKGNCIQEKLTLKMKKTYDQFEDLDNEKKSTIRQSGIDSLYELNEIIKQQKLN